MKPLLLLFLPIALLAQPAPQHNLEFSSLPKQWDQALPQGNGHLGSLLWQKGDRMRLSLDRADVWDLRPMKGLDRPEFNYAWVAQQVSKGEYGIVQQYFDAPYEQEAGPTKLPCAALEFSLVAIGNPESAVLDISDGLATVRWSNGTVFQCFVQANAQAGWYRWDFSKVKNGIGPALNRLPQIIPPAYGGEGGGPAGSVTGDALARLGYTQGSVHTFQNGWSSEYRQVCWGGYSYSVAVSSRNAGAVVEGVWSIACHTPGGNETSALARAQEALPKGFKQALEEHRSWWREYWQASSVQLPDTLLERQYYLDMYKFGCIARADAPMISLQAVWTADNGRLPPWKGDLHHDLNTEMSYWPAYAANHLSEASGYLNHLDANAKAHRQFTKQYFGNDGLNVPGVTTLSGEAMGGWIQYSCSPTTVAWLSWHYYQQWRYSADTALLERRIWPFFEQAARHLEAVTILRDGKRVLPISSSPEINDNDIKAWFPNTLTNYDLALIKFVFEKAAELALETNRRADAVHWISLAGQLPPFATEADGALEFAPNFPYRQSHRHFSNLMAIYPLGLLDIDKPADARIIRRSLAVIDSVGPDWWTGYSWAWLACLRARAREGDGARDALHAFAEAFVSPNSFHLNGDQSDKGYSQMHYTPFTLEGNFAFAAGVQEMLLQSNNGVVRVFPALPSDWRDVSFQSLRTAGGFLVSAEQKAGKIVRVEVRATANAQLRVAFAPAEITRKNGPNVQFNPKKGYFEAQMRAGDVLVWETP